MKPKNSRSLASSIHFRLQSPAFGLAVAVSSLAIQSAHAATWVGDTSQDWNNAANWDSDPAAPTGNFIINTDVAGVFPIVGETSLFSPVDVIIGTGGLTGRLDQNAGIVATGAGNWLIMGEGGTGTFNLNGGTFNAGEVHIARTGTTGTATVNVSGTLTTTGATVVADGQNNTASAVGTLNVENGGSVTSENDLLVAFAGSTNTTGVLNIASGATVTVASATKRWLIMNMWDACHGVLNVNGGTLNLNANTDLRFSTGNFGGGSSVGASSVNLNSGLISAGPASVVDLNTNADNPVDNTLNLNGGTLSIGGIISSKAGGTRVVNFNGGILKPTATSATFFPAGAASTANVRNLGAIIDSGGFDITIGQALSHSTVGGDNATDGGLTKEAGGVLTLAGINTYNGNTTVNAGQLTLADNGRLTFVPAASGVSNKLTGTGVVQLDGDFAIDTTGASTIIGDSWTLVTVGSLTETYGTTFTVTGWSEVSAGVWKSPSPTAPFFRFTEATGVLAVIGSNDSDVDGLDDLWEDQYFGDNDGIVEPADTTAQNGAGDPDADGFDNTAEFIANTAPNNPAFTPDNIDGDGMDDAWENLNFGSITRGPTEDPDGDLANNLLEFINSTDPNNINLWPDSDTDSMNDGWETTFFGDLSKDGFADTDVDGFTDLEEHEAHTNPSLATGSGLSPIWSVVKNRWSFTGNLTDSVGGSNAQVIEVGANDVLQNPTSVTLTGGDKATSDYVKLGSNLLPKSTTPVTIELWAKQNSIKNWSRIFDFHASTTETLFMSWTMALDNATDRLEFHDGPNALYVDNANQPYGIVDEQHIVLTLEPLAGTGGTTRVTAYSAPSGAADLGPAQSIGQAAVNLVNFNDALNALGYSPWPDETANATYNEFRIWNGALSGWMREKLHDQGPDDAAIPDADGDKLPDAWETQYFANTTSATSLLGDNDTDTFTNREEYLAGSNPNNALSTPTDTDADGLTDEWEITHFTNLAQTATGDFDGDGTNNLTEYRLGLLPASGSSSFAVTRSSSGLLEWPSAEGLTFIVQRSTTLGAWENIATVPGTVGTATYTDPTPPAGQAFYRILLQP